MRKNKIRYIFLFLACAALILYIGHLFLFSADLSRPQRCVLLKQGDEYIVRFDITNTEPTARNYTISVLIDGRRYYENTLLGAGRVFTYKQHIYPPLQDKMVNVSVYRENEPVPVSENTYII